MMRRLLRPCGHRARAAGLLGMGLAWVLPCCSIDPAADGGRSPFQGLVPHPLDGSTRPLPGNSASLGALAPGAVVRLRVNGANADAVLLLLADAADAEEATLVGGGPANAFFDYPVQLPGTYLVFVPGAVDAADSRPPLSITALPGPSTVTAPVDQHVRVRFDADFLTGPGLFDPVDGTPEQLDLLRALAPVVRDGIVERLRTIFAATPIVILGPDDPDPAGAVSTLTYRPDRVEAADQSIVDAALPPPDPTRPDCQVRVVFGEVLPAGTRQDPGNQVRDDAAVVYVGSFQGRGAACATAAINSVSSMVLTLAQTGAHEIGHLVGLYHVEQIDLMNRSATLAFLRELSFARGQIQLERIRENQLVGEVFPAIVQDPSVYFAGIFAAPR